MYNVFYYIRLIIQIFRIKCIYKYFYLLYKYVNDNYKQTYNIDIQNKNKYIKFY